MPQSRRNGKALPLAALAFAMAAVALAARTPLLGPERLVSREGAEAAIAAAGDGSFVVVWTAPSSGAGTARDVFAQRFSSAGPSLGRAFQVNDEPTGSTSAPAVAADRAGGFVVVWAGGEEGSGSRIFGQLFGPDGERRGDVFQVDTASQGEQILPAVAMSPAGDFVVAWEAGNPIASPLTLQARRFAADATPRGPQFRVDPGDRALDVAPPALAMEPHGGFAVGWTAINEFHDPACPQLQCFTSRPRLAAYGPDGAPRGRLQLDASNAVFASLLGAAAEEDYLALWTRGGAIRGRRVARSGRPVGPAFVVQPCLTGSCPDFAAAARDAHGRFVVVVRDDAGNLYARLFQPTGTPAGLPFAVTSLPATSPRDAAVALADDGTLEAVWRRLSDGVHRAGLFRRLIRG